MVCRYGTPLRKMSPCGVVPRLGTAPSLLEKASSSEVRFSSKMLSPGGSGFGSGVGVTELLGRKMVLKPFPTKSPANAASGPSGAGGGGVWATLWSGWTSLKKKSPGSLMVPLEPESLISNPPYRWKSVHRINFETQVYTLFSQPFVKGVQVIIRLPSV